MKGTQHRKLRKSLIEMIKQSQKQIEKIGKIITRTKMILRMSKKDFRKIKS